MKTLLVKYRDNMKMQKPRATEIGTLVGVRMQAPQLAALDAWRKNQDDLPTRPEAVRRLLEGAVQPDATAAPDPMPPFEALCAALREYAIATNADVCEADQEAARRAAAEDFDRIPEASIRRELIAAIMRLELEQEARAAKPAPSKRTPAKPPAAPRRARSEQPRKRTKSAAT
jgi:hypothetical protein